MSDAQSLPDPARAERVMSWVRWFLVLGLAALAGHSVWTHWLKPQTQRSQRAVYWCPMHPDVQSPEPGECPICHMDLEPIPTDRNQPTGPMGALLAQDPHAHREHPEQRPPGLGLVTLRLARVQVAGIRTETVHTRELSRGLRAPAVVEAMEGSRAEVHVRTPGFLERLAVAQTSVHVSRGQTLAWLYSPTLFQAQQELLALHRWNTAPPLPDTPVQLGASQRTLEQNARQSLVLQGLSTGDIDAILQAGTPRRSIPIRAPRSGWVLTRNAVLGGYAQPETVLYEIAELSRVWIIASIHAEERNRVTLGAEARFFPMSSDAHPSTEGIATRVHSLEPSIDRETRTARLRLELDNEALRFLPGQYGEVELRGALAQALVVTRDAVVETGTQQYVFVSLGEGRFEPRRVRTGTSTQDSFVEILEGLEAGEEVVTRGVFMLDSESKLLSATEQTQPSGDAGHPDAQHGTMTP